MCLRLPYIYSKPGPNNKQIPLVQSAPNIPCITPISRLCNILTIRRCYDGFARASHSAHALSQSTSAGVGHHGTGGFSIFALGSLLQDFRSTIEPSTASLQLSRGALLPAKTLRREDIPVASRGDHSTAVALLTECNQVLAPVSRFLGVQ